MSFRLIFRKLVPHWLSRDDGERILYSLAVLKDASLQRIDQGLRAKLPQYGTPTALSEIGRDRRIIRGRSESDESYAARLVNWRHPKGHKVRGNPFEMLRQLRAYINEPVTVRAVDRRGNWFTIDTDGTESYQWDAGTWNWDGAPASPRFARGWVIIYGPWQALPTIGDPGLYGGAIGDPDMTIGSTMDREEVATIRAIVREWKPGGVKCEWVILALDFGSYEPGSPEPDGTWLNWTTVVADVNVPARLSTSRFFQGVEGAEVK